MILIFTLDGRSYAVRNERLATHLLEVVPYLVPVDFDPRVTPKKIAPKVQQRAIELDVCMVHDVVGLKAQAVDEKMRGLSDALALLGVDVGERWSDIAEAATKIVNKQIAYEKERKA